MTPLELAQNMAASDDPKAKALGVAMVARSLSDDDGLRQGWPVEASIGAAFRYLGVTETMALREEVRSTMATVSDALLNRRSTR